MAAENHLPLLEFSLNAFYHTSLRCEVLQNQPIHPEELVRCVHSDSIYLYSLSERKKVLIPLPNSISLCSVNHDTEELYILCDVMNFVFLY